MRNGQICNYVCVFIGRGGKKRKAEVQAEAEKPSEVKSALLAARPELTVVLNPEKPRRNSFEITLLDGETSLWTGIKKGPPRKLKFPQSDVIVAALQEALKA
uniref:Selenoprotein H n=1 Tax=Amphilophus citrinellus TaxID=61819 RepID=A0A3Q0RDV9_AMPCI